MVTTGNDGPAMADILPATHGSSSSSMTNSYADAILRTLTSFEPIDCSSLPASPKYSRSRSLARTRSSTMINAVSQYIESLTARLSLPFRRLFSPPSMSSEMKIIVMKGGHDTLMSPEATPMPISLSQQQQQRVACLGRSSSLTDRFIRMT